MSDNKKYYYMRLKENFFDTNEMKVLESLPDGYKYSNILMKLYLMSLQGNGKLMFNDRIPYNAQMIATITRHSIGDVEKALSIFKDLGLIDILDTGAIYMLDIQNYIGKSSTEADRQRLYQNKINSEKQMCKISNKISCEDSNKKPTPEIELEIEKDIEINKETFTNVNVKKDTDKREEWFNAFWNAYPNKANKKKSKARFLQICTSQKKFDTIMTGMQKTVSLKAKYEGTQYIPMASSWLNDERWNDEPYQPRTKTNGYQHIQVLPEYMNKADTKPQEKASDEDIASVQEQLKNMRSGGD